MGRPVVQALAGRASKASRELGVEVPVNLIRPSNSLSQNNPREDLLLEQGEDFLPALSVSYHLHLFPGPGFVSSTAQKSLAIEKEDPKTFIFPPNLCISLKYNILIPSALRASTKFLCYRVVTGLNTILYQVSGRFWVY